MAYVTFGSTDKVQGQVLWHSLCALRRGAAVSLLVFCGHVGRSVSREGRRDPDHVIGDSEAQPSGRPNTSSPAECLRATQWPACGRPPRGVGKQIQERKVQCLEAAGALFPRKAPAPSSTTCDFTVGWIYTWIPQRAAESSSSCRQPASDPSTGTVSCSVATSALRFTAPLAQAWGRCGHGAAKTR